MLDVGCSMFPLPLPGGVRGGSFGCVHSAFSCPADSALPSPASASHACKSASCSHLCVRAIPGRFGYRSRIPRVASQRNAEANGNWRASRFQPVVPPPSPPAADWFHWHGGVAFCPTWGLGLNAWRETHIASPIPGPNEDTFGPARKADKPPPLPLPDRSGAKALLAPNGPPTPPSLLRARG